MSRADEWLRMQVIWEEILRDVCKCEPDEVGNRACDWGAYCDACQASWVLEIFDNRLEAEGLR